MRRVSRMGRVGSIVSIAAIAAGGCSREPRYEDRSVVIYAPKSCPVSQEVGFAALYAGGDFDARVAPAPAKVFLRDVGQAMAELPSATRSILADVSVSNSNVSWRGHSEVPPRGPVNILVWPANEPCRLTPNVEHRTGATLGIFGDHVLVVGGSPAPGSTVPNTYVGDLSTGLVERLRSGLSRPRVDASVTAIQVYDDPEAPLGALVAGGKNPETGLLDDTGELYVPKLDGSLGDFEAARVQLFDGRAEHGAVVLVTGETLLVGGRGNGGALNSLEIIDPAEIKDPLRRRSRTNSLVKLEHARIRPNVIRLASGEIMVAGGTDSSGKNVPVLEWIAPDGRSLSKRKFEPFVMGRERAFVPLEAGGALAVISPDVPLPDFKTVWVISADGTPEPALPIDPQTIVMLRLFRGNDGAPVLWNGTRWLKWDPWYGAFEPIAEAPSVGPQNFGIANGDNGLALWLADIQQSEASKVGTQPGMYVMGYRFASRTRFDAVPNPLLVTGPAELAPDRFSGSEGSSIRFERERGLVMGPGASAFLTDVTFADFSLDLDVTAAAPQVILRPENGREYAIGGRECAFGQSAKSTLSVVRRGGAVRVSVDAGDARTCSVELDPTARVAIGLRGAQGGAADSGARNLRVTRF